MTRVAEINGEEYEAFISSDGKFAVLYAKDSIDDSIFMGRFAINGDNLIEFFPMSNKRIIIGKLK